MEGAKVTWFKFSLPDKLAAPGIIMMAVEKVILEEFSTQDTILPEEVLFFIETIASDMGNLRRYLDNLLFDGAIGDEVSRNAPARESELHPPARKGFQGPRLDY